MRIQLSLLRHEDGAVAVMTALLAVLLIVVAAFTTDFGMAYAQRQALATGADSAALAVINTEYTAQLKDLNRTCATALDQDNARLLGDPAKASTIALAQINANAPFGTQIGGSDVVTTTLSCEGGGTVLQVLVVVNRMMKPILGGVVGASPMNLNREAKAALGVVNGVKTIPLTMCTNQADAIIAANAANPASAQLVPVDKIWGNTLCENSGPPAGSGNWGWLNFGSNSGVPGLVKAINGTIDTTITEDASGTVWMNGLPGNKINAGPIINEFSKIMDRPVFMPVYSGIRGSGNNTEFKISGFLSLEICGIQSNNKQYKGACYVDAPAAVQLQSDTLQIKYLDHKSVGQMGELCALGNLSCAKNAYVTKLLG